MKANHSSTVLLRFSSSTKSVILVITYPKISPSASCSFFLVELLFSLSRYQLCCNCCHLFFSGCQFGGRHWNTTEAEDDVLLSNAVWSGIQQHLQTNKFLWVIVFYHCCWYDTIFNWYSVHRNLFLLAYWYCLFVFANKTSYLKISTLAFGSSDDTDQTIKQENNWLINW